MQKVLLGATSLANVEGPFLRVLHEAGLELVLPSRLIPILSEDDLLSELPGCVATLAGMEPYTARVFERCPELRVIARVGVGYDAVDVAAATKHGVALTITPGGNHGSVAEHTFALMLGIAKEIALQDRNLRNGQWVRRATIPLRGRTLGLVGLGRIGKAVALRALAFQMRVISHEPYPDKAFVAQHGIELVSLEPLLTESDYVSLHLPMSPANKQIICKKSLALMKPTAYLINTSRGGLVCEADLLEALHAGRIAGAALDVFEVEPCLQNPLFALDNVVVTPHAAGVDLQSRDDMARIAATAIAALCRNEWPGECVVNSDVRPRFQP